MLAEPRAIAEVVQAHIHTAQRELAELARAFDGLARLDEDPDAAAARGHLEDAPHVLDTPDHGEEDLVRAGSDRVLDLPRARPPVGVHPAENPRARRGANPPEVFDRVVIDLGVDARLSLLLAGGLPVHDDTVDPGGDVARDDLGVRRKEEEPEGRKPQLL